AAGPRGSAAWTAGSASGWPASPPVPARPGPGGAARCGWGKGIRRFLRRVRAWGGGSFGWARFYPHGHELPRRPRVARPAPGPGRRFHASIRQDGKVNDIARNDDSQQRLDRLADISQRLLARARALGATQAEVSCSEERGLNVSVRMGEVETVESSNDRGLAVTVYFGQRQGSASTADLQDASLAAKGVQACAIARYTEDDEAAGLADAELMARAFPDLDTWHPWRLDADKAVELALACEAAGREADPRVTNSDGASFGSGESLSVYANSHGFIGRERETQHSLGLALIAGQGEEMQRDGWYSIGLAREDLETPVAIGRRAAERAVSRLQPRRIATGEYPVLFSAEVARSLVGHLLGAVSGGALYRRASFLLDSVGTRLFPEWLSILEHPLMLHGLRSSVFDADGVATRDNPLVVDGIL